MPVEQPPAEPVAASTAEAPAPVEAEPAPAAEAEPAVVAAVPAEAAAPAPVEATKEVSAEPPAPVEEVPAPQPPKVVTMDEPAPAEEKATDMPVEDTPADPVEEAPPLETPSAKVSDGAAFLQDKNLGGATESQDPPAQSLTSVPASETADVPVDKSPLPEVQDTVEYIEEKVDEEDPVHIPMPDQTAVGDQSAGADSTDLHPPAAPVEAQGTGGAETVPQAKHAPFVSRPVEVGAGPEVADMYSAEDVDDVLDIATEQMATTNYFEADDQYVPDSSEESADTEIDISGEPAQAIRSDLSSEDQDRELLDDLESSSEQSAHFRKWSGPAL